MFGYALKNLKDLFMIISQFPLTTEEVRGITLFRLQVHFVGIVYRAVRKLHTVVMKTKVVVDPHRLLPLAGPRIFCFSFEGIHIISSPLSQSLGRY